MAGNLKEAPEKQVGKEIVKMDNIKSNEKATGRVPKGDSDMRKEHQESSRDIKHPHLENRRFTELPTPLLDLYLKVKSKPTNGPLTPPPNPTSKNLNRPRQSTPAISYHDMPAQRNCPTISESLNRLAIGKASLPTFTQFKFPLNL